MRNDIKKLSELIIGYLDKVGLFEQSKVLEVYSSWSSVVGEKYAAHSKLIDIKHQNAVIETDHPGWCQQILLNKRYIIKNFQKKYPQLGVKNISVIVSSQYADFHHSLDSSSEVGNRHKARDTVDSVLTRQEGSIKTSDTTKAELPYEIQEAFERLKKSIIEKNRSKK